MPNGYTTIPVGQPTRDRVKSLKRGGESYDELLQRLADEFDGAKA